MADQTPLLTGKSRHAFGWQMAWSIAQALAEGILANAPVMALKMMAASDWQMGIRLCLSSLGMFAGLIIGWIMAGRSKRPFVFLPGMLYGLCITTMAMTDQSIVFLSLFGLAGIFDLLTRPAVTAIVRQCYDAPIRSHLMGRIRSWSSLAFLLSVLGSALSLEYWPDETRKDLIHSLIVLAGVLILIGMFCFAMMPIKHFETDLQDKTDKTNHLQTIRHNTTEALGLIKKDRRLHQYLFSAALFGFGGLLYVSFIPASLTKDHGCGYLATAVLLHVLPATVQWLTVSPLCKWFDRVNTWRSWSVVRLGWGLDPICLALAILIMPIAIPLVILGRILRGATMGGSWVLWWQTGIHQFAPPGEDTTRYMSLQVFINGMLRLIAPLTGMLMIQLGSRAGALLLGGSIVLIAALHAHLQAKREKQNPVLANTASFEQQYKKSPLSVPYQV
ncbi:MAG: MFS transporter [Phycisphaeraceae bacterium JB051]